MANQASINATPDKQALRNVGRIHTLRQAIEKSKTPERTASLQAELDRRLAEVQALRDALDSIDA